MRELIDWLNPIGETYFNLALSMLIQSSALIIALYLLDFILRRRVKAVLRYMIWLLVLIKLLLPPSLSSPVSIVHWSGDLLPGETRLQVSTEHEHVVASGGGVMAGITENVPLGAMPVTDLTQSPSSGIWADSALTWQSLVLLGWVLVVSVMMILLLQRMFFVRGLVAQSHEAPQALIDLLRQCRAKLSLSRSVKLRYTAISTSPAVCGLLRPTILLPDQIVEHSNREELQSILLHELAHIKRGDLWVHLMQTLLQVLYFFHPLLWIANATIRKVREQAVDETVLAALGREAETYPKTLVTVSRMVFGRPTLSLRLMGIVESKRALSHRIKHMTTHPFPTSVRIGVPSLVGVLLIGALLLPMARAVPLASNGTNTSEESAFRATLPNGISVEMVGVSRHFIQGQRPDQQEWWRPNGQVLEEMPYAKLGWSSTGSWETTEMEFALRVTGNDDYTIVIRSPRDVDDWWVNERKPKRADDTPIEALHASLGEFQKGTRTGDISLGVATGNWETVEEWNIGDWTKQNTEEIIFYSDQPVIFTGPRDERGGFVVTVTHAFTNDTTRLMLIDKNGTAHQLGSDNRSKAKGLVKKGYYSWDVNRADIDRFVFEKRSYQWVHFKNVSLEPGFATEVGIVIETEDTEQ